MEVLDAAAVLRLGLADAPDRVEIRAALDGAEAGGDVVAHVRVEHEPIKLVVRLRGDEHTEVGRFAVGCAVVATARVAVICRSRGIRWQGFFVFRHKWIKVASLSSFAPLACVHFLMRPNFSPFAQSPFAWREK